MVLIGYSSNEHKNLFDFLDRLRYTYYNRRKVVSQQNVVELELNQSELEEARDWIKDCLGSWRDLETEEDVDDLSDSQVIKGINKNYCGGLKAFKESCN